MYYTHSVLLVYIYTVCTVHSIDDCLLQEDALISIAECGVYMHADNELRTNPSCYLNSFFEEEEDNKRLERKRERKEKKKRKDRKESLFKKLKTSSSVMTQTLLLLHVYSLLFRR